MWNEKTLSCFMNEHAECTYRHISGNDKLSEKYDWDFFYFYFYFYESCTLKHTKCNLTTFGHINRFNFNFIFNPTILIDRSTKGQSALDHILQNWLTDVSIISWAACGRTISVGQTFGRARQTSKVPTACLWGRPFSGKVETSIMTRAFATHIIIFFARKTDTVVLFAPAPSFSVKMSGNN